MRLNETQRENIKNKFGSRCAYCGSTLPESWHADHVEPVMRDGYGGMMHLDRDNKDNIYPACAPCNLFKKGMPLEVFRLELEQQNNRARKKSVNFRMAEKFGLLKIVDEPVIFWFEQYLTTH